MNKAALFKASIAASIYTVICVLINSYPRFELFRIMKWLLEFPAFFVSMLLGGNVHEFNPFPIYVIYGVVLFAIVYSALSVQDTHKGTTTAT